MKAARLFRIGVIGTVVTALCCFTPVLVVVLTAVGLAGVIGALDMILLPLLFLFIGVAVYAGIKRTKS